MSHAWHASAGSWAKRRAAARTGPESWARGRAAGKPGVRPGTIWEGDDHEQSRRDRLLGGVRAGAGTVAYHDLDKGGADRSRYLRRELAHTVGAASGDWSGSRK